MITRLADRLYIERHRRFVGRQAERALFESVLPAGTLPFQLLFVFGPGGVGKTSLLHEFTFLCRQQGVPFYLLDGSQIQATPEAFLSDLPPAFQPNAAPAGTRQILFVDNYEQIARLDVWLREQFIPQLSEATVMVISGRNQPGLAWQLDPGWQALLVRLPLRNLTPTESRDYLQKRQVPAGEHQLLLDFTHGYPLALSLAADMYQQQPGFHFRPEQVPDMIKTLLDRLIQQTPGPDYRLALEACALVRVLTEPLLVAMFPQTNAQPLFDWLRGLSFIESRPFGLAPHEQARKALVADIRWRNPELYAQLVGRARQFYIDRLAQLRGREQQNLLIDYVFLHRHNPVVQPFFAQVEAEEHHLAKWFADMASSGDWPILRDMVAHYEGDESAQLADFWFARQPEQVVVFRGEDGVPAGFMMTLALHRASRNDLQYDPATQAAWNHLQQQAPLRPGERATHFRFWMTKDSYQDFSALQALMGVYSIGHYLTTPQLAYTFFPFAQPALWQLIASYADLHPLPAADYQVGGHHYGVYAHDWRLMPPAAWLDLLAGREITFAPMRPTAPRPELALLALSQPAFLEAVRKAIRDFTRPDLLATNPLLRSRLVLEKGGEPGRNIEQLQQLITNAVNSLQTNPRDQKFYRAVQATYLQPSPTQTQAADLLNLPIGTYRRHLKSGLDRIAELLWQREVAAGG